MNILMPQLGETVAEGKITKWFKSAGDAVKPGDNLFEIETDKVSMEVPATEAGVLSEIRVQEGETAPVGAIVGVIGGAAAGLRIQMQPARPASEAPRSSPSLPAPAPAAPPERPIAHAGGAPQPIKLDPFFEVRTPERNFGPARLSGGVAVTPLARRLATEAGIDLARVRGSGPRGRIVARDVETAAALPGRCRAAGTGRSECRTGQGALRSGELRGGDARRHAPHHRGAASPGEADHSAFLRDRRCRDRPPQGAARGSQCRGAERPRRRPVVQALAQRFHHPRAGARFAARAGCQRRVGGRPHPALQARRHRRCRRARGRADNADRARRRHQVGERDLGRDEGSGGARARQEAQTAGIPGRLRGNLQSRHVRRARIRRHHQPAACDDPRRRRRAPPGGGEDRRRRRLRQHADGDALLRSPRGRRHVGRRACWRCSGAMSSSR